MKAQVSRRHTKPTPVAPLASQTQEPSSIGVPVPRRQPIFDDVHARIAVRAYELYVERGRREGYAEQDWLDAEREILDRTFPV
ncbi:MAG: DUF2934 domain-containing protein [Nitrospira sp.]